MKLTPLQKRAERKARNNHGLDMNLVALIDIFTILIFFLMSSTGVEVLSTSRAVKLPESTAEKTPRETIVVTVSGTEILVDGRKVATVGEAMAGEDDLIAPLKAELDLQASRPVLRKENEAQGKAVTIMGDKDIPYRLLRKVMYTAARANFSDVAFAVTRKATT
ncbi:MULTISPECIES: biopolymer transporter ExbD [unclassified Methylibium]|jgi:biopolymer transport protein TolR|uniref:ExbD/TolR family protein n=1 Tax=unclassified Methylibium TaxID=2633235 RepID=UPI0006F85EF2|nr:biopolymer transporter ExbD [Methylibium sp. Root1272]KQW66739.1 gliding motility protein [Methylibium sp. Root1272]